MASSGRQARRPRLQEEKIFYPQLLKRGAHDPEGETLDAIGDHNDIRDGVREANAATVGSDQWWAAVGRAREANDDHMGEEEREGLSDFRRNAPTGLREALGRQYSEFMAQHPTTRGLPTDDRDPQTYVENIDAASKAKPKDSSLGIGSLKGVIKRELPRPCRHRCEHQPTSAPLGWRDDTALSRLPRKRRGYAAHMTQPGLVVIGSGSVPSCRQ